MLVKQCKGDVKSETLWTDIFFHKLCLFPKILIIRLIGKWKGRNCPFSNRDVRGWTGRQGANPKYGYKIVLPDQKTPAGFYFFGQNADCFFRQRLNHTVSTGSEIIVQGARRLGVATRDAQRALIEHEVAVGYF